MGKDNRLHLGIRTAVRESFPFLPVLFLRRRFESAVSLYKLSTAPFSSPFTQWSLF